MTTTSVEMKLTVASLDVNNKVIVELLDVFPSFTSVAVIVIVGNNWSTAIVTLLLDPLVLLEEASLITDLNVTDSPFERPPLNASNTLAVKLNVLLVSKSLLTIL